MLCLLLLIICKTSPVFLFKCHRSDRFWMWENTFTWRNRKNSTTSLFKNRFCNILRNFFDTTTIKNNSHDEKHEFKNRIELWPFNYHLYLFAEILLYFGPKNFFQIVHASQIFQENIDAHQVPSKFRLSTIFGNQTVHWKYLYEKLLRIKCVVLTDFFAVYRCVHIDDTTENENNERKEEINLYFGCFWPNVGEKNFDSFPGVVKTGP